MGKGRKSRTVQIAPRSETFEERFRGKLVPVTKPKPRQRKSSAEPVPVERVGRRLLGRATRHH